MTQTTRPKIRAAVIGAGWYGAQNHIPTLAARPEVALDGVSRLGPAELARSGTTSALRSPRRTTETFSRGGPTSP